MNKILSLIAVLGCLACIPVGIVSLMQGNFVIGAGLLFWSTVPLLDTKPVSKLKKLKAFTLIELIVVITIISFLLTVTFRAMSMDTSKADITKIGGELKLLQTQARAEKEIKQFILAEDYFSKVTMSHDELFFNTQGEPTDIDGNQLMGFYIQAKDDKALLPIKVFIRPFTGKVTFIEL
jgi:prepilin-type N-terminal cleavage/methylation domain-containing protein